VRTPHRRLSWSAAARWVVLSLGLGSSVSAVAADPPPVEPPVKSGDVASRDAALVIGNEAYLALPQSQWSGVDARSFADWLAESRGVSKYRSTYLENVDSKTILKHASRLRWRVKRNGTAWIYYAGHGVTLADGRRALVPIDVSAAALETAALPLEDLVGQVLRNRNVKRVVVVVDASFGARGRDGFELVPGREVPETQPVPVDNPTVVYWLAERGTGDAQLYAVSKHGLFTWTALGGLRGWADGSVTGETDGQVTLHEAQQFSYDAMRMLGRKGEPSVDARDMVTSMVMAQGGALEKFPGLETFEALAEADTAARLAQSEKRVRADAEAFWRDTVAMVQQGGPEGRAALEAYVKEFQGASVQVQRQVYLPQVADARRMLLNYDESAPPPVPAGATPAAPPATCDDLVVLEGPALMGELEPGVIACLDRRTTTERLQTTRNKVSRLLIVNAESKKDWAAWEQLVQRHLEDIDRSDPDLCFRYSVYLHKQGDLDLAEEVIHWAGYALENKQVWEPPDYAKKVNGLHRLRAEAAHKLWVDAEQTHSKNPTPETDQMARDYRGMAKSFSREWLDYARASGQKTEKAYQMCLSAAGAEMFCAAD
jgi:hypothetical protein